MPLYSLSEVKNMQISSFDTQRSRLRCNNNNMSATKFTQKTAKSHQSPINNTK